MDRLTAMTSSDGYSTYYTYNSHSGPSGIKRYGRKTDGTIGLIDDILVRYRNNRPLLIGEFADDVIDENSSDFAGTTRHEYDAQGRMIGDSGRGISNMTYNHLDLPGSIEFKDGTYVTYAYSATGQKLSTTYVRQLPSGERSDTRYYSSGAEFVKNGTNALGIGRYNTAWGYVDGRGSVFVKMRDYQGNIRGVVSSTGTVVQTTDYYPYGTPMQTSAGAEVNRYKYGAKEFETEGGLNQYDFEARTLIPQIGMFTTPDPNAGDYPWVNPYLYCAANPLKYIDPTGEDVWKINEQGAVVSFEKNKDVDRFEFVDNEGKIRVDSEGNKQTLEFKYGTVIKYSQRHYASFKRGDDQKVSGGKADVFEVRGDSNATELFEMFAKNVTAVSQNEVSLIRTGYEGDEGHDFISSGHVRGSEPGMSHLYNTQLYNKYNLREMIHTHPNSDYPSRNDLKLGGQISNNQISNKLRVPKFQIFNTKTKSYMDYK